MVDDKEWKPDKPEIILANASLAYAHDTLDAVVTELLAGRPLQAAA